MFPPVCTITVSVPVAEPMSGCFTLAPTRAFGRWSPTTIRGARNELRISGLNLGRLDRLVLGDSLAEGHVFSADPGTAPGRAAGAASSELAFRIDVPANIAPGRYELHAFTGKQEIPLTIPIL